MTKNSANELHDPTCGPEEHAQRSGRRKPVSDEAFERAASLFRTAADVSRLKLLERLADGEWCVTELAEAAGSALSTVSQQLRMLRAERIVSRRRAGKHVFYSLADRHVIDMVHNALEHAAERRHFAGDGAGDGAGSIVEDAAEEA
jgi:DNA-binding transcriptional ArsR family regulator